jgi:hypothetical protein
MFNPEILAEVQQIRNLKNSLGSGERNFIKLVQENQSPGVSQAVYEKFGKTNLYGVVWWKRI